MKKKKITNKVLLIQLKELSIKLRSNYQIPYELCRLIRNLDSNSSENEIIYLKNQCEHLMRVKGYYKKYPSLESRINEDLLKSYSFIKG